MILMIQRKKLDQDAEDTHTYDLLQVEIRDVDAPTNERDLKRIQICKTVWKKYGRNLPIFAGTADFLLYIAEELEEDTSKASLPSTGTAKEQYVDHFGPFTIVLMFYMCAMAYSQLF